jgi:hypothetical protein
LIRHFHQGSTIVSYSAYYSVEKSFHDYAADIEAVNIHYVVTLIGGVPDWEHYRCTRYMPIVNGRARIKVLKLPREIPESTKGGCTARYLLHHYFEIFQGGDRYYTSLFTEEIDTNLPKPLVTASAEQKSATRHSLLF